MSLPEATTNIETAKENLNTFGLCVLQDVLTAAEVDELRNKIETQATAERALGDLAPKGMVGAKQFIPNMVNKGRAFLDLIERRETVLEEASPTLRERLGLRTYGTMGTVGGTGSEVPGATLQSDEFDFPEYIIGEGGSLHPLKRVSRQEIRQETSES